MKFITNSISDTQAQLLICFKFENEKSDSDLFQYIDSLTNNQLSKQINKYKVIKGAFLEQFIYSIDNNKQVLVYGLGNKKDFTLKKLSEACANVGRVVKKNKTISKIGFEIPELSDFFKNKLIEVMISALRIGLYDFDKYLSSSKNNINQIEILDNNITSDIEKSVEIGALTSYAMKFVKDLVNEPAQNATPEAIANIACQLAKDNNMSIEVLLKDEISRLGMNAFLAVGQGSVNEPRFIHLTYKPECTPKRKIALIGKGITFDAGGMDIKPATSMLNMKDDMTGAATVLAVIQTVAKLKLDIEVHAICALCENMTSGKAYKQGDVLTAMNGLTIEVENTDAEGRITLADALCFADTLNVDEVIDIATLTGAAIVALGNNITGVMGNNQKQIDKFIKISNDSCENTWQMPILDELKDNLKSEIANFKNTGGRSAGTSTAAWFLSNFTKSSSWLHLDIAGTAYLDKSNKETLSGPTGVMVRSLINYLLN